MKWAFWFPAAQLAFYGLSVLSLSGLAGSWEPAQVADAAGSIGRRS